MSRKKDRVPSKNSLTIRQRISQLFENLEYESEIADPSSEHPSSMNSGYGSDSNSVDDLANQSIEQNQFRDNLLLPFFNVPPPEPSDHSDQQRAGNVTSEPTRYRLTSYLIDQNGVKMTNQPVSINGDERFSQDGSLLTHDNENHEILLTVKSFIHQKSGQKYQINIKFRNQPDAKSWNIDDHTFVENVILILSKKLEFSDVLD